MKTLTHLLLIFLFPLVSISQVSVIASVDKNPVAIDEKFQLTFTVLNHEISGLKVPSLSAFEVISGPNTTTNMQYVNGVSTTSGSYIYFLKAKEAGRFTIDKASVSDSGQTYFSDELNITVTKNRNPLEAVSLSSGKSAFDDFFKSSDSLYFKDGKAMAGKSAFVQSCVDEMDKKKNSKDDLGINAEGACSCMYETVAKYYTYKEFTESLNKKGADIFTKASKKGSPAYNDIINCVFSNMSKGTEKKEEKSGSPKESMKLDDAFGKSFVESCESVAKKSKDLKKVGLDVNLYCECTWDKIKEKGLSMEKISDLQDPNSPLFNEIISPCLTKAMKDKNGPSDDEIVAKNANDITGNNPVEKIALVKLMGVYKVKVVIGGIEKYFTLDSGASEMFISSDMERELLLEGLIKKSDYMASRRFRMANGDDVDCRRLKLNNIKIGGYSVNNVTVAISDNSAALLLLGKTFLDKFSHWSIDNKSNELVLTR